MFKVGDIVEAFGIRGIITEVWPDDQMYPVTVDFDSRKEVGFTKDGKHEGWHKTPSLILIERPKKTRKVICVEDNASVDVHVGKYDGRPVTIYSSFLPLGLPENGFYTRVKITLEFEVEE